MLASLTTAKALITGIALPFFFFAERQRQEAHAERLTQDTHLAGTHDPSDR